MPIRSSCRVVTLLLVVVLAIVPLAGCGGGGDDATNNEGTGAARNDEAGEQAKGNSGGESAQAENRKRPRLKIVTSLGDIVVELDAQKAQLTVDNFLQYADAGFYEGTIFHDVDDGYAVMGGQYTEDLTAKRVRVPARNEARNGLKNVRGTIAMARKPEAIDSATSIFFINLADNPHLDHKDETAEGYGYCVFGKVVEGMDVADKIGKVKTRKATAKDGAPLELLPAEAVVIRSIRPIS